MTVIPQRLKVDKRTYRIIHDDIEDTYYNGRLLVSLNLKNKSMKLYPKIYEWGQLNRINDVYQRIHGEKKRLVIFRSNHKKWLVFLYTKPDIPSQWNWNQTEVRHTANDEIPIDKTGEPMIPFKGQRGESSKKTKW